MSAERTSIVLAALALIGSTPARADDSNDAFILLFLAPSEIGADVAFVSHPHVELYWCYHWPLGPPVRYSRRGVFPDRVILEPSLQFGRVDSAQGTAHVTAHLRGGYQRIIGYWVVGIGSTLLVWPALSPSMSPEAGLRFPLTREPVAGFLNVLLRADYWITPPSNSGRVALIVGISLW